MDHRLRREIVATFTTNSIVNRAGITFVRRLSEESGHGVDQVARAYAVARDAFGLRDVWAAIEALDNKVEAEVQTGSSRKPCCWSNVSPPGCCAIAPSPWPWVRRSLPSAGS